MSVPGKPQRGTGGQSRDQGQAGESDTLLQVDLGLESPADEVPIWALAGDRRVPLLTSRGTGGGRILILNVTTYSRGGDKGLPGIPQVLADQLRRELLGPLGIQFSSPTKVSLSILWR